MRIRLLASAVVLVFASPHLLAQTYLVRTKESLAEGKSAVTQITALNRMTMKVSVGGKVLKEEKAEDIEDKQFTQKVLEAGTEGRSKRYSNTYTKAVKGPKNAPVEQSYAGKTVIYELKDDKYVVTAEAGVSEKDLAEFTKTANKPRIGQSMYSDKPVKVGETWKVSQKALELLMGDADQSVNLAQAVATGKLLKVYKKNGQQWGTIEVIAKAPFQKLGPIMLSKPIEAQMIAILDTAIDGSSTEGEMKGYMTMKGQTDFTQNGTTIMLDVDGVMEHRQVQGPEK